MVHQISNRFATEYALTAVRDEAIAVYILIDRSNNVAAVVWIMQL